jgi:hypothetical protein
MVYATPFNVPDDVDALPAVPLVVLTPPAPTE